MKSKTLLASLISAAMCYFKQVPLLFKLKLPVLKRALLKPMRHLKKAQLDFQRGKNLLPKGNRSQAS